MSLFRPLGCIDPVKITLEKHIPVGAGLGGGSADAAALRLINKQAEKPLDNTTLYEIAANLGADVPVCLGSYSARVAGIGTKCTPIQSGAHLFYWSIHGNPIHSCRVQPVQRGAFRRCWQVEQPNAAKLLAFGNDLLAPACRLVPEINTILVRLRAAPGCVAATMSGSGASCLGIFTSPDQATAAANRFARCWLLDHANIDKELRLTKIGLDCRQDGRYIAATFGLGRSQVVRHRFLVSCTVGSNPTAPANSST